MARGKFGSECEVGDLLAKVKGERGPSHEERVRSALLDIDKGPFEVISRFYANGRNGDPEFPRSLVQCCQFKFVVNGSVAKESHSFETRYDFFQNLQPLPVYLQRSFRRYAGDVSARMREALNQSHLHRKTNRYEYRRHGAGEFLGGEPTVSPDDQQVDLRYQGSHGLLDLVRPRTCKPV